VMRGMQVGTDRPPLDSPFRLNLIVTDSTILNQPFERNLNPLPRLRPEDSFIPQIIGLLKGTEV